MEENENIVTLSGTFGTDVQFEFMELLEYDDVEYLVLLPIDKCGLTEKEKIEQVWILRVKPNRETHEDSYFPVENKKLFKLLHTMFKKIYYQKACEKAAAMRG